MVCVSVVIPTYNRANTLLRSIDSVISQSYNDLELIIVDDASTDNTGSAVSSYDDDRIEYIKLEENRGAPVARNKGSERATGDFIAFLDDDDGWKTNKINKQIERFRDLDEEYAIVYTGREKRRGGSITNKYHPSKEGDIHERLLKSNIIPSETPLIRKDVFIQVGGFDPSFKSKQDLDLWLRITKDHRVSLIDEILAFSYKDTKNRIGANPEALYQGQRKLIEKHIDEFRRFPDILSHQYLKLGIHAANTGRNKEAKYYFKKSYNLNNKNIRSIVAHGVSNLPNYVSTPVFNILWKAYSN